MSTVSGIGLETLLVLQNAPNARYVQCDRVRRKILWAERLENSTRILEADMENPQEYPEFVFEHPRAVHLNYQGLVHTDNVWLAFRRRCSPSLKF